MNVNALPLNPAVVAAALNQAGWGLIGNMQQNRQEPSGYPSSSVGSNNMTTPQPQSGNYNWMTQASNSDHVRMIDILLF